MSHHAELTTAHPPTERPLLVWDDDNDLCRLIAARLRYQAAEHVEAIPLDALAERLPDVPAEVLARDIALITTDGHVALGAAAMARVRALSGRRGALWRVHARVPLVAAVLAIGWRRATAGPWAGRLCRWLIGPDLLPRQHRLTRWLFLRLVGVAALCAFVSLYTQLDALMGAQGIQPAEQHMRALAEHADRMESAHQAGNPDGWSGVDRYLNAPTVFWLGHSDAWLHAIALLGILLCLLLILDIWPGPVLLGIWLTYLSLVTVGGIFFRYQWDTLLLETLLVAMFLAPWRRVLPRLAGDREPSRVGIWVVRLLVFKLMFLSGAVKLLSKDVTWKNLTALDFHYFTQPIPTWTSYYSHHLPHGLHAACTAIMFFIELVLPFFLFGPRRLRLVAFWGFLLLMVAVGSTGNYGFFNLLTAILALSLCDDTALRRWVPRWLPRRLAARVPDTRTRSRGLGPIARGLVLALAIPVVIVSTMRTCTRMDRETQPSRVTQWAIERTAPFSSINSYGLFASMTTTRPEIIVEGSRDGVTWEAYEFRYKPGDLDRRPRFAGPHMPRLDWQMWFAALRDCRSERWFHAFLLRLLDASPPVRAQMAHDPFGDDPPRYIRSTLYMYTFAERDSPSWWHRELVRPYCPVVTLVDGQLVRAQQSAAR